MVGIDGPRLHIAVAAIIGIPPLGALSIFERRVLGLCGAPAVLIVHGLTNPVADESPDKRAADGGGDTPSAMTELVTD